MLPKQHKPSVDLCIKVSRLLQCCVNFKVLNHLSEELRWRPVAGLSSIKRTVKAICLEENQCTAADVTDRNFHEIILILY